MLKTRAGILLFSLVFFTLPLVAPSSAYPEIEATYLYNLANFTGTVPYMWARVSIDDYHDEIYVISGDTINIFNARGMLLYEIRGFDMDLGAVVDVAVDKQGNLLVFAYNEGEYSITVCNFRGEPIRKLQIKDLPPEYADWKPNRMLFRDGTIYLVSMGKLRVVALDSEGTFKQAYDISTLIKLEGGAEDNEFFGFSIGKDGDILFTLGAAAKAYRVTPDLQIKEFGKRGSGPGKFGVPAGIVQDNDGNYLVSDMLRSRVIIFNDKFEFVKEFGSRGLRPGQLIVPRDLAIDRHDRLYVNQGRYRGISVFQLVNTGPSPPEGGGTETPPPPRKEGASQSSASNASSR